MTEPLPEGVDGDQLKLLLNKVKDMTITKPEAHQLFNIMDRLGTDSDAGAMKLGLAIFMAHARNDSETWRSVHERMRTHGATDTTGNN
jgi:hypothetical protein